MVRAARASRPGRGFDCATDRYPPAFEPCHPDCRRKLIREPPTIAPSDGHQRLIHHRSALRQPWIRPGCRAPPALPPRAPHWPWSGLAGARQLPNAAITSDGLTNTWITRSLVSVNPRTEPPAQMVLPVLIYRADRRSPCHRSSGSGPRDRCRRRPAPARPAFSARRSRPAPSLLPRAR